MGRWVKYRQALTQTTTQKNSASSSRAPSPTMNTTSTTTASNKRNLLSQSNYTDPKSSEMNSIVSKCSCPPTTDPRFQWVCSSRKTLSRWIDVIGCFWMLTALMGSRWVKVSMSLIWQRWSVVGSSRKQWCEVGVTAVLTGMTKVNWQKSRIHSRIWPHALSGSSPTG